MKKQLLFAIIGISIVNLTGCYTQIAIADNDDSYTYTEPQPIIIVYPAPEPIFIPVPTPLYPPIVTHPKPPREKIRKPVTDRAKSNRKRDPIRNSGGRNNNTGKRSR